MMNPYRISSDRSDERDPRYLVTRTARRLVKVARWLRLSWYWNRKTEQHRIRIRRRLEKLLWSPAMADAQREQERTKLRSLLETGTAVELTLYDGENFTKEMIAPEELLYRTIPELDLSVGSLVKLSPDGAHAVVTKMAAEVRVTNESKYNVYKRPPKTPPRPLPPPKKSSE